jgi:hypothetical protein
MTACKTMQTRILPVNLKNNRKISGAKIHAVICVSRILIVGLWKSPQCLSKGLPDGIY